MPKKQRLKPVRIRPDVWWVVVTKDGAPLVRTSMASSKRDCVSKYRREWGQMLHSGRRAVQVRLVPVT